MSPDDFFDLIEADDLAAVENAILKTPSFLSVRHDVLDDTGLHIACNTESKRMVALLIQLGADVNARGNYDNTPLHSAVNCGGADSIPIVKLLLSAGADVNLVDCYNRTPAQLAKIEMFGLPAASEVVRMLQAAKELRFKSNE